MWSFPSCVCHAWLKLGRQWLAGIAPPPAGETRTGAPFRIADALAGGIPEAVASSGGSANDGPGPAVAVGQVRATGIFRYSLATLNWCPCLQTEKS